MWDLRFAFVKDLGSESVWIPRKSWQKKFSDLTLAKGHVIHIEKSNLFKVV